MIRNYLQIDQYDWQSMEYVFDYDFNMLRKYPDRLTFLKLRDFSEALWILRLISYKEYQFLDKAITTQLKIGISENALKDFSFKRGQK